MRVNKEYNNKRQILHFVRYKGWNDTSIFGISNCSPRQFAAERKFGDALGSQRQ